MDMNVIAVADSHINIYSLLDIYLVFATKVAPFNMQ